MYFFVYFLQGCLEEVKFWFMKNMYILGVLALTVAVIQVCTLFCCIQVKVFNNFDMYDDLKCTL